MSEPTVKVLAVDAVYGQPTEVEVTWGDDEQMVIRAGDVFRSADWRMQVTVRSFWEDGTKAHVDRTTSRRKQAIDVVSLARRFHRISPR